MKMNFDLENKLNIFTMRKGETIEIGVLVGSEHPCYEKIQQILSEHKAEKERIKVGDVCEFNDVYATNAKDEIVQIYITNIINEESGRFNGLWLNGRNKGINTIFNKEQLKKTDKYIPFESLRKETNE